MSGLCSKGCGRPVKIRGYCNGCYQAKRTKWIRAGIWPGMPDATGTARRLQALAALGWPPSVLARRIGVSRSTFEHIVKGHIQRTSAGVVAAVSDLYEELSMTPGPSDHWRRIAADKGWAPPLAWDDDTIDNPDAAPDLGAREHVDWAGRYREMRDLGYSDIEILHRWNMQPASMIRQMERHGLPWSPALATLAAQQKWRRATA